MNWKRILTLSLILVLSVAVSSFAEVKKKSAKKEVLSEKEFTGIVISADGLGRVYWIQKAGGTEEADFTCDDKSLLISKNGKKAFSTIAPGDFIDLRILFGPDKKVTVKYVETKGKRLVKTIGQTQ